MLSNEFAEGGLEISGYIQCNIANAFAICMARK
jgi:hypothetical protein